MKYAFNTWAYSSFPCWVPSYTLKETIERLARIGYDGIELGCAQPHAWPYYLDKNERKEIQGWLKDNNIVISSVLAAPGGGPGANVASSILKERAWTIQHLKDVIDLGMDLCGCKTLVYVAGWIVYGTPQEDAWQYCLESLVEVGNYAARYGVNVMIEPTAADSNLVETADDALLLMEQSGLSNVFVMFDTAHVFYRNEVPSDYIYRMDRHLRHIHLTDYNRKAPGTAGCDFVPIMQALIDINYDGYVTIETGFASRAQHPDSAARLSLSHLKAIETDLMKAAAKRRP